VNLADCDDVLTIQQLCAVLKISEVQYYRLKRHGAFPIDPLPSLATSVRYAKAAVQRWLENPQPFARKQTARRTA
jgi:predicted DNA-binding transcriptional regulator AlpA